MYSHSCYIYTHILNNTINNNMTTTISNFCFILRIFHRFLCDGCYLFEDLNKIHYKDGKCADYIKQCSAHIFAYIYLRQ